jgi:multimeric flavodoxin WrbA
LERTLTAQGQQVNHLILREMDLRYCIGCFGCWVKTPGRCVTEDASAQICQAEIQSDFVLWASPLIMGFPSALLKQSMDKSIPLVHPYFVVEHGEAHHLARYDRYPRFGLLLAREDETTPDDLHIVDAVFSRTAINLKSRLDFTCLTDEPVDALAQAITRRGKDRALPAHPAPVEGVTVAPPSRLTIFNGSPRGRKGNTPILLEQFRRGFDEGGGNSELFHLNRIQATPQHVDAFAAAESVLLGFPLYTDAMPGLVKAFMEALAPLCGRPHNPPIGFLVQSGFPESAHSRYIEQYLPQLAQRLGSPYLGAIVKGGCEGVHVMPEQMNRKLFTQLHEIGRTFGRQGSFAPVLLRELAGRERYPAYLAPLFKVLSWTPLLNFYWNRQLKQNGVYAERFARPYLP